MTTFDKINRCRTIRCVNVWFAFLKRPDTRQYAGSSRIDLQFSVDSGDKQIVLGLDGGRSLRRMFTGFVVLERGYIVVQIDV